MLTDPVFRKILFETLKRFYQKLCCVKQKKGRISKHKTVYKQFEELLDSYNNTNSFLYSSLNMEIVYSILKGINVIVRELNIDNKVQTSLNMRDF